MTQLQAYKIDSLEEMDRFSEKFNLEPTRNRNYEQANHKHWNGNCGKKSPQNKNPGPNHSTGEF